MKKLLMYFFFLGLLFLSACSKDDSLMYCCDPSIDSWVKNNLDELEGLSRAELVMNGVSKTKAAYRVFKPEKRAALWLEKLSNYIELKRNAFSHEEKEHIEKLRNFISPEIFATESRSEIHTTGHERRNGRKPLRL